MTGKVFVDSNVLIYAHDADAGPKHERAAELLRRLWSEQTGRLSTQVLQEFYVTVTLKIKKPLAKGAARELVRQYAPWVQSAITPETVARASEISEVWRISFWDSMIIAAAEQGGASAVLTEDLNAGQRIAGVLVVNPLA